MNRTPSLALTTEAGVALPMNVSAIAKQAEGSEAVARDAATNSLPCATSAGRQQDHRAFCLQYTRTEVRLILDLR